MSKYRQIGHGSCTRAGNAKHIELLLGEACATIEYSVLGSEHDPVDPVGQATIGNLRVRYSRVRLDIGWIPEFDRWVNSTDWIATPPNTLAELQAILAEAERLGAAGDSSE